MAFPLLFAAILFAAGVGAAEELRLGPEGWAALLVVALLGAWALYVLGKTRAALAFVMVSFGLLGAGRLAEADARYDRNPLRALPQDTYVEFSGTVVRAPGRGIDRDFLFIRPNSVRWAGQSKPVRGLVRIAVPHSAEYPARLSLAARDRVTVAAQISPPKEYRNFAEPFSRMYLKAQGLHALAATKSPLLVQRTRRGATFDPRRLISLLRQACQARIETAFPAPPPAALSSEGAVFEALILGERGRMDQETNRTLQQTGLYHLFAISGAHIGIVSVLIFALLKFLRVPLRASYGVLLLFLLFYALLVEGRSSVIRAVIMAAAFIVGKLFWKDAHLLNTIGTSALLLLLWNPFQLFDVGFQLTFAATLGIILFYPRIKAVLPRLPLGIADLFGMSVAAQAAVLPLIARSFNRIIFSGLLLNFIGIPLVGLIMAAGYVFLPLSFAAPFLARPAAAVLAFLVKAFLASAHLLDGIPVFSYRIPTPPAAVVAAYFAFLLLFLVPAKRRFLPAGRTAGFVLSMAVLVTYPFPCSTKDLVVTVMDVGQGDSILVEFPGKAKMLVDGGGSAVGAFDVGENVVAPFLWNKGLKRLNYLVLTHAHPDHLNGLEAVARDFPVAEFWRTAGPPPPDGRYMKMEAALAKARTRLVARGDDLRRDGITIEILSPRAGLPDAGADENDRSLVLRVRYGRTAVLLAGDIGAAAEEEILAAGLDVRSQALKAPHHGSESSSSPAFLDAVGPEVIVISVGRGNSYSLPGPAVLERYRESGARVFRTDLNGAVEIRSDGRSLRLRTSE